MRTRSLLPIDQLNNLNSYLIKLSALGEKLNADEIIDSVLDLLILAYVYGNDSANEDLGTKVKINRDRMNESIYTKIADKTFEDRIKQYTDEKADSDENTPTGIDIPSIVRVAETEAHRVYCESQFETAKQSGLNVKKTWITMLDEKVRDTHEFLEGVSVGLNEKFHTFDGDSAYKPGGFDKAENNINCRCELRFDKE